VITPTAKKIKQNNTLSHRFRLKYSLAPSPRPLSDFFEKTGQFLEAVPKKSRRNLGKGGKSRQNPAKVGNDWQPK
jgi:hypothetical protein